MTTALPHDYEAEKAVICCYLMAPVETQAICMEAGFTPMHFYFPAHTELFTTFVKLASTGKPLDFPTIAGELKASGKIESVGGFPAISELYTYLPTASNVAHHVLTVCKLKTLREIIRIGSAYAEKGYDLLNEPRQLAADMHGELTSILSVKTQGESITASLNAICDELINGKDDTGLLKTGITPIDKVLSLYLGDLLIVTAPTSCGKSVLSVQIALSIAEKGNRVAIYTLEMQQRQCLKRAIAQLGSQSIQTIKDQVAAGGFEAQKTIERLSSTRDYIKSLSLHIRHDLRKITDIVTDIRTQHARHPFKFIVIDYLQIIGSEAGRDSRQRQIALITQHLKELASTLNIVICVPSQVNKDGGTREAEDAENDSSALIKISPEYDELGHPRPGLITLWKQREGARFVEIFLKFNPPLTRFDETRYPYQPPEHSQEPEQKKPYKPHHNTRKR